MEVETQVRCVLEELSGMPVREICRRYGLSRAQYFCIRERFLEGGRIALAAARPPLYDSHVDDRPGRDGRDAVGARVWDIDALDRGKV